MSSDTAPHVTAATAADADLEQRARRRVGFKMGFLLHLAVYVAVNAGLYVVYALNSSVHTWRLPIRGWALGLAIHGLVVLWLLWGDGLRTRLVDAEVQRLRRRGG